MIHSARPTASPSSENIVFFARFWKVRTDGRTTCAKTIIPARPRLWVGRVDQYILGITGRYFPQSKLLLDLIISWFRSSGYFWRHKKKASSCSSFLLDSLIFGIWNHIDPPGPDRSNKWSLVSYMGSVRSPKKPRNTTLTLLLEQNHTSLLSSGPGGSLNSLD